MDQVRDRIRSREYGVGVHFDTYCGPAREPARIAEQQWDDSVLHEALDALERFVSDLDFKLFVMCRFHEASISELSQDTGLGENTIRSKLRRTLKAFETIVEQRGYRDLLFRCD